MRYINLTVIENGLFFNFEHECASVVPFEHLLVFSDLAVGDGNERSVPKIFKGPQILEEPMRMLVFHASREVDVDFEAGPYGVHIILVLELVKLQHFLSLALNLELSALLVVLEVAIHVELAAEALLQGVSSCWQADRRVENWSGSRKLAGILM